MQLFNNGYLICDSNAQNLVMKICCADTMYNGIHRFHIFPLVRFQSDPLCKSLNEKQSWIKLDNNKYKYLSFISNESLLKQYVVACYQNNISVRCLFIKSEYSEELCLNIPISRRFLGYEVSEIPFSEMTLSDLYCNVRFDKYRTLLNENGLFSNERDAYDFKTEYKALLEQDLVGDGYVDVYVCAVYEVDAEAFMSQS